MFDPSDRVYRDAVTFAGDGGELERTIRDALADADAGPPPDVEARLAAFERHIHLPPDGASAAVEAFVRASLRRHRESEVS
jgi:hypothetical protein